MFLTFFVWTFVSHRVAPSVSSTSFELLYYLHLSHSFLFQSVYALWTRLPKRNWRNPGLKYCPCCSLSYLVSFPSDNPFLISFFPSFSFHLHTFLSPLSPPAHSSCLSFLLLFTWSGFKAARGRERGLELRLELRLWWVDLSHWCWL